MERLTEKLDPEIRVPFYIKMITMWTSDPSGENRREIRNLLHSKEMLEMLHRSDVQEILSRGTMQDVWLELEDDDFVFQTYGGRIYQRIEACWAKLIHMQAQLSSIAGFEVSQEEIVWAIMQFEYNELKMELEDGWNIASNE